MKRKMEWCLENWKLGVHLILKTKRFGVNNEWWCKFDSMFGVSFCKRMWMLIRIYPIIDNYKQMKFRARIGFVDGKTCEMLGWK